MQVQRWTDILLLMMIGIGFCEAFYISKMMEIKVENDETFMVVCRDDVDGLSVTWHNPKGKILGPNTRPRVVEASYGYSIVFNNPRVADSGNYTCSTAKDRRVFVLIVEPALKFIDTATNQTGVEGKDFVLKCEATGGNVTWALEGGTILEASTKFKAIGDGLLIRNVTRHDSKTYICKAIQERTGTVLDRKIHFHVKHRPIHPSHPQKHMRQDVVYGYVNGTVNLTCVAVANPPATFEWRVNDKKAKIANVINESPEVSILQLHIDSKAAFGNYKCTAVNKYGSYEENFSLKEGVKPAAPASVEIKEIQPKLVIFEIIEAPRNPEMDGDARGFRVQYRKIDEKEWKQRDFNITKNNLYSLDNLEANSEYELQAATRNIAGLSDFLPSTRWKTSQASHVVLSLPLIFVVFVFYSFEQFW